MKEFGLFNDEGIVEGQFYTADEAEEARSSRYLEEDALEVHEVCPDHPDQIKESCETCHEEIEREMEEDYL